MFQVTSPPSVCQSRSSAEAAATGGNFSKNNAKSLTSLLLLLLLVPPRRVTILRLSPYPKAACGCSAAASLLVLSPVIFAVPFLQNHSQLFKRTEKRDCEEQEIPAHHGVCMLSKHSQSFVEWLMMSSSALPLLGRPALSQSSGNKETLFTCKSFCKSSLHVNVYMDLTAAAPKAVKHAASASPQMSDF